MNIKINYCERFRNFIKEYTPKVSFVDDEGKTNFRSLPHFPITESSLRNAGADVNGAGIEGYFKEWKEDLLHALYRGGDIEVWKELRKLLRHRAGLPYTSFDYIETFAEDCQLVADYLSAPQVQGENGEIVLSKITSKQVIATALGLTSVYKLNTMIEQGVYDVRPVIGKTGKKTRQSWQIRIDKLPSDIQKKLKP